jgi:hypothetical protein
MVVAVVVELPLLQVLPLLLSQLQVQQQRTSTRSAPGAACALICSSRKYTVTLCARVTCSCALLATAKVEALLASARMRMDLMPRQLHQELPRRRAEVQIQSVGVQSCGLAGWHSGEGKQYLLSSTG